MFLLIGYILILNVLTVIRKIIINAFKLPNTRKLIFVARPEVDGLLKITF